ncbi:MAG TPA: methyltransferase domain-containing protein [Candidatus Saccharimonadales bacterium]
MSALTIEDLHQQQFEEVLDTGLQDAFVRAEKADHYEFSPLIYGTGVLNVASNDQGPLTLLDIGAGAGAYLAEAKQQRGSSLRAVGITALKHFPEQPGVEYVYGDIQRQATWQPQESLTAGSVDIAVSCLTFQHLIDPLAALRNTFSLLKPGGHLFVDAVILPLPARRAAKEVAAAIGAGLRANTGQYGCSYGIRSLAESHSSLIGDRSVKCIEFGGHLRKDGGSLFEGLEPHIAGKSDPIIAYSLAKAS